MNTFLGMRIILHGADGSRWIIYDSTPAPTPTRKISDYPFVLNLLTEVQGFLGASVVSRIKDTSQVPLAEVRAGEVAHKRTVVMPLGITVLDAARVSMVDVRRAVEQALPATSDPIAPAVARLEVESVTTDGSSSRYIGLVLSEGIAWPGNLDMTISHDSSLVATAWGDQYWDGEVITTSVPVPLIAGATARLAVSIENPGDVETDVTWRFSGAGSYTVPDLRFVGPADARKIGERTRMVTTPLLGDGEVVELTTAPRPPIMSSRGHGRSKELLRFMGGAGLATLLPPRLQPVQIGVDYHTSPVPAIPKNEVVVSVTPKYWSAY